MSDGGSDKPKILQDAEFTVEEGLPYRLARTAAIWLNKLFFSSLILLVIWLVYAGTTGVTGCAESPRLVETANGTIDDGTTETCSVFLSETAKFLGAMAIFSFIMSLVAGGIGLVVGKRILEATPTAEEVGAPRQDDAPADEEPRSGND